MDTQTVTLITVVAGFLYQAWAEIRRDRTLREREILHRAWDQEDRRLALAAAVQETTQVAVSAAGQLAVHTTETAAKLEGLLAENTKISTDAFHEANTVNLKLEALGLEHNAIDRLNLAADLRGTKD